MRGCPCPVQCAERGGPAGTRRVDQQIKHQPGTGDAGDGDGLVEVEPNAPDLAGVVARDELRRQCWPTGALAVRE